MVVISSQFQASDWINPTPTATAKPFVSTITQIDYFTATVYAPKKIEHSTTNTTISICDQENAWNNRVHQGLPVLLAFAIIGMLSILGSLIYLVYRFYQANRNYREHRRQQAEKDDSQGMEDPFESSFKTWLSLLLPCCFSKPETVYYNYQPKQREPIRYEKSDLKRIMNDDDDDGYCGMFCISRQKKPMGLPVVTLDGSQIDNLNVPISSTFVPIDISPLKLVPRSEIWFDDNRRRGVDELELWERRNRVSGNQTIVVPSSSRQTPPLDWILHPQDMMDYRVSLPRRHSIQIDHSLRPRSSIITTQDETNFRTQSEHSKQYDDLAIGSSNQRGNELNNHIVINLPKPKQLQSERRLDKLVEEPYPSKSNSF